MWNWIEDKVIEIIGVICISILLSMLGYMIYDTNRGSDRYEYLGTISYLEMVNDIPVMHTTKDLIIEMRYRDDFSFVASSIDKDVYLKYNKWNVDSRYHGYTNSVCVENKHNCFNVQRIYGTILRDY